MPRKKSKKGKKKGEQVVVEEPVQEVKEQNSVFSDLKSMIMAITHDEQVAKTTGTMTGVNVAVIYKNLERIIQGEATEKEIFAWAVNIGGIILGAKEATKAFDELYQEVKKAAQREGKKISKEELKELWQTAVDKLLGEEMESRGS